ncbi:alpha/beta hydrolase [Mycolicibacterium mengxianglii]|uniref:alpha/beta hydrolase n=1 Tax=Mycolicibacterium mengxianglii TaxID=2736649 RepID=UPI0018EEDC48|nr:alpha/beta hydrolase [Mycolicibacterium mengxianglii]
MARAAGWLGAGVLTAGVSAALFAGAGLAQAVADESSDPGVSRTSAASTADDSSSADDDGSASPQQDRGAESGSDDEAASRDTEPQKIPKRAFASNRQSARVDEKASQADPQSEEPDVDADTTDEGDTTDDADTTDEGDTTNADSAAVIVESTRGRTSLTTDDTPTADAEAEPTAAVKLAPRALPVAPDNSPAADSIPILDEVLGPFQPDYPPLVRAIGSAVFNFIGALVQAADGPPVVPPELRDSIHVSSSTLVISPGNEVAADWYFPTEGQPERLIYLQHGILASSPMYSYTAAYLAQRTNSVVVATTLTSNPFAEGGLWLGGDNMHAAVAQLFLDENREALNASLTTATLKDGRQSLTVPTEFVLIGHSLGGGFAPGVTGHYAEGLVARRADGAEAENHLAGVVLLDGVPFSPILPNAMDRLKKLEESNNGAAGDYVPVYEIGAPLNFLNSTSAVNQDLSAARPGKFNGVVINGGVHMDGMLGGNPLIQASAYLVAGIPKPENPAAVQRLMAGWINDMFDGNIDPVTGRCLGDDCAGVYGDPGGTVVIPGDNGEASAVVIGSRTSPMSELLAGFQPLEAATIVRPQRGRPAVALRIAL